MSLQYANTIKTPPTLILEVGIGSGIISVFLKNIYNGNSFVVSVDINPTALKTSVDTFSLNQTLCDSLVRINMAIGCKAFSSQFDLIVCNPPYVPTELCELQNADGLQLAWAGGPEHGNDLIKRLLTPNLLESLLSANGGTLLLVVESRNDPKMLLTSFLSQSESAAGWEASILLTRPAGIERLSILRLVRRL